MKTDLLPALAGGGVAPGRSRSRLRHLVLVPQIAVSLVLLLVTGVFVRTMLRLELAPSGYDPAGVVALDVQLPQEDPQTNQERKEVAVATHAMHARMLERVAALPGVTSAALTFQMPHGVPLAILGTTIIARSDYETTGRYRGVTSGYVSADYFKTLGIPVRRGRVFDTRDENPDARTAVASERLANEIWPGQDPIGQQIAMHQPDSPYPIRWLDVLGVVGSVTLPNEEYPRPTFYVPIATSPLLGSTILVRGGGNPAELSARAKRAIVEAEPRALVTRARPVNDAVNAIRFPRRFSAALLGASGTAALALAAIGVFALMSYAVAQRMAEIGVRMVLGAQRRDVVRLILKDGAAVVLIGVALGFLLAFAAIRYASHAIVPLPDTDAVTFVIVPLLLAAIVLLACYLPARRASRVDPLVVLRMS